MTKSDKDNKDLEREGAGTIPPEAYLFAAPEKTGEGKDEAVTMGNEDNKLNEYHDNNEYKKEEIEAKELNMLLADDFPENNDTVASEENPFSLDDKSPADIMHIFYNHDIPIIPVVSKRGILLGILKKEDVISELSDISRGEKYTIDRFITQLAKKMSFEELLPFGAIRSFPVINLFGEHSESWTRLQLFAAAEKLSVTEVGEEVQSQKEEQVIDWFIYLILEHIPRPLYALNDKGKTMFYNSLFELLYNQKINSGEVDTPFVETTIHDVDKNDFISGEDEELYFYNKDFDSKYEKVPLITNKQKVGYLLYFDDNRSKESGLTISPGKIAITSLDDILSEVEKQIITSKIRENKDLKSAADALKISRGSLTNRMKKLGINT